MNLVYVNANTPQCLYTSSPVLTQGARRFNNKGKHCRGYVGTCRARSASKIDCSSALSDWLQHDEYTYHTRLKGKRAH